MGIILKNIPSFYKLDALSKFVSPETKYFLYIDSIRQKLDIFGVLRKDISEYVEAIKNTRYEEYKNNPQVRLFNPINRIKLASCIEFSATCIYSIAEIFAKFINKASNGTFSSRFTKIVKTIEQSGQEIDTELKNIFRNDIFGFYKKLRELRVEWVHYSTIFIAGKDDNLLVCINCERKESDKIEFKERTLFSVSDFLKWTDGFLVFLENLSKYLLIKYVVPSFCRETEIAVPEYDENGWPIMIEPGRLKVKKVTMGEILKQYGF